jgi:hypothetical protein
MRNAETVATCASSLNLTKQEPPKDVSLHIPSAAGHSFYAKNQGAKPMSRSSKTQQAMPSAALNPGARNLSIQNRRVEELKPDPKNPRIHSEKQVRQIARSIQTFGFNVPVLIDGDLRVIAGHGRIQACTELGIHEVPTIRAKTGWYH